MGFDPRQRKALRAKLRHANVRARVSNGATVHYIEGWKAVAEANRIFGHENWDRETRAPTLIWSDRQRGQVVCLYSAQVRISVRAGGTIVTRDGVGTGFGRSSSPEAAHEMAMKAAETDATKRALATFGNPFGLALYDKDMSQVTRPPQRDRVRLERSSSTDEGHQVDRPKVILTGRGRKRPFSNSSDLVDAVAKSLAELETVDAVYAFWEENLATFASVLERDPAGGRAAIDTVTAKLKARLRELGRTAPDAVRAMSSAQTSEESSNTQPADPSAPAASDAHDSATPSPGQAQQTTPLVRAKERRVRDADHLAFVSRHPCLVCGRRPAQAHHVRFAQPRAMALKVSDEYTVPLCVGHHDAVHRTGDERAWWSARQIDPLAVALQLWTAPDKSAEFPAAVANVSGAGASQVTDKTETSAAMDNS
jgi:DNA recombination protein Rad52